MKRLLGRMVLLAFTLVALLAPPFCLTVQADDGDGSDNCTPSANVTVTITIISRGGGGGGGGGAWPSSCPYRLKVTMFGTVVSWVPVTYYGETCQKFEATKKAVTLKVARNTSCRDKDGKRLEELEIADCAGTAPSSEEFLIIDSYCLTSKGEEARFSPPLRLTLSYEPSEFPEGVAETDLFLGYYADGRWNRLAGTVNASENNITTDISQLAVLAILTEASSEEELPLEPKTTPSPSPPDEPYLSSDEGLNWWWLIGVAMAALIIAGLAVAYLEIKRKKKKKT